MEKILQPLSSPEEIKAQAEQARPVRPATNSIGFTTPAQVTPVAQNNIQPEPTAIQASTSEHTPPPDAVPQFLTGSSMAELKQPLPKGIYLIVGFQLVGVVLSFFSSANDNMLFALVQIADLLFMVGLLLRLEFVRKTIILLTAATIIFSAVDMVGLLAVQDKVNHAVANYNHAVDQIDQRAITEQQRDQLTALNAEAQELKKKEGRAMVIAELNIGVEVAVAVGGIAYLTRPKVRAIFRSLEP